MIKIKPIVCLIVCIYMTSIQANDFNKTLNTNEAAGYVDTIESFIQKAGTKCQPLLSKDEVWKEGLMENWLERNGKYSEAVALWTEIYLNKISLNNGEGMAQYEAQKILSVIDMRGSNAVQDIIKGNDEEKTIACAEFEQKVINGELDITHQSPYYDELENLVKLF